jgi:thioredoxin 1
MRRGVLAFCWIWIAIFVITSLPVCWGQGTTVDQTFAPLERWKDLVIAGDASGLKLLYSSNPVAHIQTASRELDADADVQFWTGIKAKSMKLDILQNMSPQPGSQQITFQAEIRSAVATPELTVYITESQLWQQQNQEWRLVAAQRSDPSRLQQPSERKDIYDAHADAHSEIKEALKKATAANKRVLVIFGANWCYDCHVLDLAFTRPDIAPVLKASYVVVHVDVGQGEKNQDLMQRYDVPMERGIPAAAVLDSSGKLLVSQKKGEFEKARELGPDDLLAFLNKWKSKA